MKAKAYTFTISLYCTLMIWSAFMAIDRHAFSSAAVAGPVADQVEAQLKRAAATSPAGPAVLGTQPDTVSSKKVIPVSVQSVVTFKQAVDIVLNSGFSGSYPASWCQAVELDCGGQPWAAKAKGAGTQTILKSFNVGAIRGANIAVLMNNKKDNSGGRLYIAEVDGTFVRGYEAVNHVTTRMSDADARAGFIAERDFWLDRLTPTADKTASSN